MIRVIVILFLLCIVYSCGTSLSGTSTETTNGFTVAVSGTEVAGTCQPGNRIGFYSIYYNPAAQKQSEACTLSVLGNGTFRIRNIKPGKYNFFIWNSKGNMGYCIQNILIDTNLSNHYSDTMQSVGSLTGTLHEIDTSKNLRRFVCLEGTPFFETINSTKIAIDKIPAGKFNLLLYVINISTSEPLETASKPVIVEIYPGKQTELKEP